MDLLCARTTPYDTPPLMKLIVWPYALRMYCLLGLGHWNSLVALRRLLLYSVPMNLVSLVIIEDCRRIHVGRPVRILCASPGRARRRNSMLVFSLRFYLQLQVPACCFVLHDLTNVRRIS